MNQKLKNQFKASVILLSIFAVAGGAWAYEKKQTKIPLSKIKQVVANSSVKLGQQLTSKQNAAQDSLANTNQYPWHKNISTTYFWAGEPADGDNKNISNVPSAWDDSWEIHFGGIDDPQKRNGFVVATFVPKENSFYFALPYNDFDSNGKRKKDASSIVPWANSKQWGAMESMLKNQWIKITKNGKTAYAQWEDVGPFGENDSDYVFGDAAPQSKTNKDAGLDVSPAVRDYLGLADVDKTDWQFVDASMVPDGPWKKTITTSQIFWK